MTEDSHNIETQLRQRRIADRRAGPELHYCLHEDAIRAIIIYINRQNEKEKRRKQLVQNVTENVVGWGVIVALTFLGKAVYTYLFKENKL